MSSLNPDESPQAAVSAIADDAASAVELIPFAGSCTFADAMEAHHLAWPEAWSAFRRRIFQLSLTIIGGVSCTFIAARTDNDFVGFLSVVVTVIAGGWLAKVLITFAIDRRRLRVLSERGQWIFKPTAGEVTQDGIVSRQDHTAFSAQWRAFRAFRASPNIIVFYWEEYPEYFFMGRTKFASDADWERVLELAAEKLPRV